jgi:hypothetical protein
MSDNQDNQPLANNPAEPASEFAEFEIGKHRVPWFLWVFFAIIITWASVSWYPFFGY